MNIETTALGQLDAGDCSPSSLTPETDAMIAADQHHLEDDNFFPATVYWRMCDVARTLEREVKRWKEHFIPFAIIHAAGYGRDHYGEGCLHFTHYDLLAEAGARMDDFKRCGAPTSPENAERTRGANNLKP